jgi:hypothetical protein
MKLVDVKQAPNLFKLFCIECWKRFPAHELLADIEGKAFHDYYCKPCAEKKLNKLKGD